MRYYSQMENCCMPTALYQVGAISIDILHDFEKNQSTSLLHRGFFQQEWARKYFSPLIQYFDTNYTIGSSNTISMPLTGKGILVIQIDNDIRNRHAISYENGRVLDPAENYPEQLPTWEEYTQTFPDRIILKVLPTG